MSAEPEARRRFAETVVARLHEEGHVAYWAGGCVRDLLLGLTPSDYDVATDATPERVMALFPRTVPVGLSFGVVRVRGPRKAGEVEVATFRSDGEYLDGRRPESVRFGTPEADASRRDFTVNGLFLDPAEGAVIDHVGGRADLDRKILRAIGDPAARFQEDKLRLLRAIRFAARFGLEIEPATGASIRAMAPEVRVVAAERIAQELVKMLADPARARAFGLLEAYGLIAAVLPELEGLSGIPAESPGAEGRSRWEIALGALANLPRPPGIAVGLATLWDGLGPPASSLDSAVAAARRLKLSNEDRERFATLVARRHALDDPAGLPEAERKRRLSAPGTADLLDVLEAIARAEGSSLAAVEFARRYRAEEPEGPIDPPPLVTGRDLREALGLEPGPRFKELLDVARHAQLSRQVDTTEAALEWLNRWMRDPRRM